MKVRSRLRRLLWPLSQLYGVAVRIRAWFYVHGWLEQKRLNGTVISVGNISVGGTGKTPMVIWLAERFLAQGKRVAILSRGYRGSGGTSDEIDMIWGAVLKPRASTFFCWMMDFNTCNWLATSTWYWWTGCSR